MLQLRDGTRTPASVIHRRRLPAPAYWIDTVDLSFDLDPAKTRVPQQDDAAPQPRRAGPGRCAWTAKS